MYQQHNREEEHPLRKYLVTYTCPASESGGIEHVDQVLPPQMVGPLLLWLEEQGESHKLVSVVPEEGCR